MIIQVQILLRYGQHPSIISLRDMFQDQGKVLVIYFEINIRCILCLQIHKYVQKMQVFNHVDEIQITGVSCV